jgi:hypothetical protein
VQEESEYLPAWCLGHHDVVLFATWEWPQGRAQGQISRPWLFLPCRPMWQLHQRHSTIFDMCVMIGRRGEQHRCRKV